MSKAFKCDRCGEFQEDTVISPAAMLNGRNVGAFTSNANQELCNSCKHEFERWWRNFDRSRPA